MFSKNFLSPNLDAIFFLKIICISFFFLIPTFRHITIIVWVNGYFYSFIYLLISLLTIPSCNSDLPFGIAFLFLSTAIKMSLVKGCSWKICYYVFKMSLFHFCLRKTFCSGWNLKLTGKFLEHFGCPSSCPSTAGLKWCCQETTYYTITLPLSLEGS